MNSVQIIVTVYFLVIILAGTLSFFRVRNADDYFVSGKRGKWWQITGSLFATVMGGSAILGTLELGQKAGWAGIWLLTSAAAGLFVLATFTGKVSRLGRYTLPELIRDFYGTRAERTAGILIPLAWTGVIAVQIIAGAKVLSGLHLTGYQQGAWICGMVFLFYTLAGGQVSVIRTDFLQALIIIAGIITLFVLKIRHSDLNTITFPSGDTLFNANFHVTDLLTLLITYAVTFTVGPDIYSRIFCAQNSTTARNSVILVACLLIPVSVMLTFLAFNTGTAGSIPENGLGLHGPDYLPPWATGIAGILLLAAVMSSADTTLLTSSMILAELITGNLKKKNSWNITRMSIIILGLASLVIALHVPSVLDALLVSLTFFSGAFVLPVIAALAGLKVNRRLAFLAMIIGGFTALAGKILQQTSTGHAGYMLIVLAYLLNALLLFFPQTKKNQSPESVRES